MRITDIVVDAAISAMIKMAAVLLAAGTVGLAVLVVLRVPVVQ